MNTAQHWKRSAPGPGWGTKPRNNTETSLAVVTGDNLLHTRISKWADASVNRAVAWGGTRPPPELCGVWEALLLRLLNANPSYHFVGGRS